MKGLIITQSKYDAWREASKAVWEKETQDLKSKIVSIELNANEMNFIRTITRSVIFQINSLKHKRASNYSMNRSTRVATKTSPTQSKTWKKQNHALQRLESLERKTFVVYPIQDLWRSKKPC